MKTAMCILMMLLGLSSCKNSDVFKPTCTNVALTKVDWTYCSLFQDNVPIKCNDKNDTLTWRIVKTFNRVNATVVSSIEPDGYVFYYISLDEVFWGDRGIGRTEAFRLLAPLNFPVCFKKENLKVIISGTLRATYKQSVGPAEPFELTYIEEVP